MLTFGKYQPKKVRFIKLLHFVFPAENSVISFMMRPTGLKVLNCATGFIDDGFPVPDQPHPEVPMFLGLLHILVQLVLLLVSLITAYF